MALTRAQISKRYYKNNREKARQADRLWRKNNPDKARKAVRTWYENNPEKYVAWFHKRRSACGSYTATEWITLKKFHGHRCLCCGKHERTLRKLGRTLTPDHVLPIAKGGGNDISNIQPLCHGRGGCNNRKWTKHVDYRKRKRRSPHK
jgi:hypothetical protein